MQKTVLLIATFDTKQDEALFLKQCIEAQGMRALTLDAGILAPPAVPVDIPQTEVAQRGGTPLPTAVAGGDKGACIVNMIRGVEALAADLFAGGRFHGIIGIGGGQGTDIGCAAMRALPFGVPKLMVSTVASGRATFGPFVGTRDVTLMHSVADLQGLNFLTKRILQNAAGAICGMVRDYRPGEPSPTGVPVALSMLGTTTPGALRCKKALEGQGFEVVAFHQNGTGGIAMEDMLRAGAFQGVLDLALHEIGDRFLNGLHGAIRDDRLEAAGAMGVPQIVAPGSINYVVLGPLDTLAPAMRARKLIVHNTFLTLVRLTPDELHSVGRLVAAKLNRATGPTRVFVPLKGFSFPDRENLAHWDPAGNQAFIDALKTDLAPTVPLIELDAHINDPAFIDPVIEEFLRLMSHLPRTQRERGGSDG